MSNRKFDDVMVALVDYAYEEKPFDEATLAMARICMMDAIGCAIAASQDHDCMRLLRSAEFSETTIGVPIPHSDLQLGPIEAAFHIGSMIRWQEFNDTWLAREWAHPSDNLGAILAAAAWQTRRNPSVAPVRMSQVLDVLVRTYEIHGVLCLTNCFNVLGIDHVVLVKIASTIASARLLGLPRGQALSALSNAFIDGHSLRTYRHAPNAGTRKSWAAGDATARGIQLALFAESGEMGYPTAVSTSTWGFNDAVLRGTQFNLARDLSNYVVNNILFKVPNPAEYHAQTAVEAALRIRGRLLQAGLSPSDIEFVRVETQRPAMQIIDKHGPLRNAADRDHCIQYMIAVALHTGDLTIRDFHEPTASDPEIERLRLKITCVERAEFTEWYYDPNKRAIPNALHAKCKNVEDTFYEAIDYPLGHVFRREECLPVLVQKFSTNLSGTLLEGDASRLANTIMSESKFDELSAIEFIGLFSASDHQRSHM